MTEQTTYYADDEHLQSFYDYINNATVIVRLIGQFGGCGKKVAKIHPERLYIGHDIAKS